MFIGIDCFLDNEIRSMINDGGDSGCCCIHDTKNVIGYDTDNLNRNYDLGDNLSEILNVYSPLSELPDTFPKDKAKHLDEILLNEWNIFNISKDKLIPVVKEICKNYISQDSGIYREKIGIELTCNSDYMQKTCLTKEYSWQEFVDSIKEINRFHSDQMNLEVFEDLLSSESLTKTIHLEQAVYCRARTCDRNGISKENMGPPPVEKATAGRVNSEGISCLYLTSDISTALHEIRARDWDYVTIGYFSPVSDIKLVDLTVLDKISPFADESTFGLEWFAINMPILKNISQELAKPLRRRDSLLDYLPTQYISDFIKKLGYDGICYNSTLNEGGINYAIFDKSKLECTDTKVIQISSIKYDYDEIANN